MADAKGGFLSALGGLGGAISAGSSILGGISGLLQKSKGKKMLRNAIDPGYKIPKEYEQNLAQAENMARTGLPSEQYNLATTNIQRGTQGALRQLGRMNNPFAGISSAQRNQNDALANLDASNAAARRQNILQAMGARRELAGQRLAQQQYSQQRYADTVNQANALMGAGSQNIAGSLGSLGQFGMMQNLYGNNIKQGEPSTQGNLTNPAFDYTGGLSSFQLPGAGGYVSPFGGNNMSNIGNQLRAINPRR